MYKEWPHRWILLFTTADFALPIKYSIFASVQLCWPRYGIYYQIVGMGTVGCFFLIAINAAGSVDSKHRQKHGCRGELTMTSSFMN